MKNILWYSNRLMKMTFPEILYRIQLKIKEKFDKYWAIRQSQIFQPTYQINLFPIFTLSKDNTAEDLGSWQYKLKVPFIKLADAALKNKIDIFGLNYDFGEKIAWHQDIKTGKKWPLKFWSDIDIRDGFTVGGAKFVWEANRFYTLPVLSLGFKFTGHNKYAHKFLDIVKDWLNANPYPLGVNWTSGIELAIRIANLIWGMSLLEGYNFSAKDKEIINRFVWFHARHLFRYPSKYSSNNNHSIAEAFALFLIGIYFPHLENAQKWKNFGKKVIEHECIRQILPDGGSYEYSTTYLSFVYDFFLLFKIVCDKNKIDYDRKIDKRLKNACDYIYSLMDSKGNIPNIGDQDSAILVNFGLSNHENFQSILNTGALIFDRPEFKQKNFPDFKTCMLFGDLFLRKNEGQKDQEKYPMVSKQKKSRLLKESGLSIIRENTSIGEIVFVGNATPLGMPPLYAHGHLDALSFTLSVGGQEVFIDPGTYLYHSGGKWRRYFRSTAAHNTIRINEKDMTDMPGEFMFGKPYQITEHSLLEEDNKLVWRAGHDAYVKFKNPVYHTRQVIFDSQSEHLEIEDILVSSGTFKVEQFFHLHPNCFLDLKEDKIVVTCGELISELFLDKRLKIEIFIGSENPMLGWFSDSFNHLQESNSIVCKGSFEGDVTLNTRIKPGLPPASN